MNTSPDFTKTATAELRRKLAFHENDRGTMDMQQELRRMFLIQEIGAELATRERREMHADIAERERDVADLEAWMPEEERGED